MKPLSLKETSELVLLKALEKANGNRSRAAQLLKMSRAHFYRRLKACGISFTESDAYKK